MQNDNRVVFRATATDHAYLTAIAAKLRAHGQPFATRTDALRFALAAAAAAPASRRSPVEAAR